MTKEDCRQGKVLPEMPRRKMRINLKEGAQPFTMYTPHVIPLACQEDVKKEQKTIVTQGIIKPVGDEPAGWCHPLVAVGKPMDGVTKTVDLTKLNNHENMHRNNKKKKDK